MIISFAHSRLAKKILNTFGFLD